MRGGRFAVFALVFGCLALSPAVARAQSAIARVVKDTSGAVLPGVTVEVASDALIEKTRSATTDGQGQYLPDGTRVPCVYQTAGCEIDFSTLPSTFGVKPPQDFAKDTRRRISSRRT